MDADFHRYYQADLGSLIWREDWPPSKIFARIVGLPEDSAFARARNDGHTSIHELLAQVRDAVVTQAHGWRLEGKPQNYPRPGTEQHSRDEGLDLADPKDAVQVARFFGMPHHN